ncbi:MAG: ATP-binding cassette domain-containing protein [Aquificota bacterium]|nr:ATP-binding cassette domain-containing protein [Aquificota bacterium]
MKDILLLKDIRKSFGGVEVLKGVSFSVRAGEVFGFVGPNGAGKSTTMKIIMDFIRPDSGEVYIFGRTNRDPSVRRRVGFLPEHPYFYTNVTGYEFLRFLKMTLSIPGEEFRRRVETYSRKLQIDWALGKKLSEYSKGMLQRFGLLQAVLSDPDLLILDEPMSGLDPIGRRLVADLILELKDRGKTVFFSTHILPDVERICDRSCLIIEGRITDIIEGEDLHRIEDIFMERVREIGVREVL